MYVVLRLSEGSIYLVDWGVAYLKRRRDIGEGCRSLVTPGGDSGGSPHLSTQRHTAHTNDGRSMGGEGGGRGRGVGHTPQHTGPAPGFKLRFQYKHNPPNIYIFLKYR